MLMPFRSAPISNANSASAPMGFFTGHLTNNIIGTTFPTTIEGFAIPTVTRLRLVMLQMGAAGTSTMYLGQIYKLGTLNLAATGDQFTHDAATFPITRTQLGVATQPLTLLLLLQISVATTTTAPAFILKTNAGGTGYVDQDGNNVVGTKTHTMVSATMGVGSTYMLRLEDGDSGIRDISAIEITTAAAVGEAYIWGIELLAPASIINGSLATTNDSLFSGLAPMNIGPGSATSGTATSYLTVYRSGAVGDQIPQFFLQAVVDS